MAVGSVVYRERLLPHWWVWLVVLAVVEMLAVAYGAALGVGVGIAAAIGLAVITLWLLWMTSPRVVVTASALSAGGARLPLSSIRDARDVDEGELARLRGPDGDARMFVVLRPWSARRGVLVRLDDAADPHPAWLLSSRHPTRLVAALAATMVTRRFHV